MTRELKKTVSIHMEWEKCSADPKEFNQQMQIFSPVDVTIVVELDIIRENIANYDDYGQYIEKALLWEIGQEDNEPVFPEDAQPFLTPLGANRVKDLVQKAFEPVHPYAENHSEDEVSDWDEIEEIDE